MDREKLLKKMEEAQMTQQALSDAVGVTQPMIGHILSGRKQPSLALAADIARVLGCLVDDLLIKPSEAA